MPDNVNDRDFWDWFNKARGDLSVRQIEERAGCPRSRIGSSYSTKRKPTELACLSIAKGLGIPLDQVLLKAGLIDRADAEAKNFQEQPASPIVVQVILKNTGTGRVPLALTDAEPLDQKIMMAVAGLSPEKQLTALSFIKWLLDNDV